MRFAKNIVRIVCVLFRISYALLRVNMMAVMTNKHWIEGIEIHGVLTSLDTNYVMSRRQFTRNTWCSDIVPDTKYRVSRHYLAWNTWCPDIILRAIHGDTTLFIHFACNAWCLDTILHEIHGVATLFRMKYMVSRHYCAWNASCSETILHEIHDVLTLFCMEYVVSRHWNTCHGHCFLRQLNVINTVFSTLTYVTNTVFWH